MMATRYFLDHLATPGALPPMLLFRQPEELQRRGILGAVFALMHRSLADGTRGRLALPTPADVLLDVFRQDELGAFRDVTVGRMLGMVFDPFLLVLLQKLRRDGLLEPGHRDITPAALRREPRLVLQHGADKSVHAFVAVEVVAGALDELENVLLYLTDLTILEREDLRDSRSTRRQLLFLPGRIGLADDDGPEIRLILGPRPLRGSVGYEGQCFCVEPFFAYALDLVSVFCWFSDSRWPWHEAGTLRR